AECLTLHTDVRPLAILEPWYEVGWTNIDVICGQLVGKYAGDGVGLRHLLRVQALPLQHVAEVGVATNVELTGSQDLHAAIPEELCNSSVQNRCANLALDVVTDDRHASFFESRA